MNSTTIPSGRTQYAAAERIPTPAEQSKARFRRSRKSSDVRSAKTNPHIAKQSIGESLSTSAPVEANFRPNPNNSAPENPI